MSLFLGGSERHFPGYPGLVDIDEGSPSRRPDFSDQSDADGFRSVEKFDKNPLSPFHAGGVADKLAGKLVNAGIVHGTGM
ncbi:MAG: hypothetical protein R3F31_07950 [Verrucomicrobiales bacterium]